MKLQKKIIIGFLFFLLLLFAILISCRENNMRVKELLNFSKLIEHGKLDDISLTICCVGPFERAIPISLDNLISHGGDYKVVIKGKKLKKHIALLKQLNNAVMIPVEHKSQGVALVYYVFKTKKNQKIFDVAICGEVGSDSKIYHNIYVNGKGIKENDIFYDFVIPFLPKDKAVWLSRDRNSKNISN